MPKFRKKPIVINAIENIGTWEPIITWLNEIGWRLPFFSVPPITRNDDGSLNIDTLEGRMLCSVGDYLIRGVHGEFYPCKPDIFVATYEPVDG